MTLRIRRTGLGAVLFLTLNGVSLAQTPLGTAFTYQGHVRSNDVPAEGLHDFEFQLFDALTQGNPVGPAVCLDSVEVEGGLFTVQLDFGGQFMTDSRWVEVAVRADAVPGNCGSGTFTVLAPRQPLTAAPFALALPGFWTQNNATCPNIIGGHKLNSVAPGIVGATISGGGGSPPLMSNQATDHYCTVGGGRGNRAGDGDADPTNAQYATVAGGSGCEARGGWSVLAGGLNNRVSEQTSLCTIGGGGFNWIGEASVDCTIGGGETNYIEPGSNRGTISGGSDNWAAGRGATVGGGEANAADGLGSSVGGGANNQASGAFSVVPGGTRNYAGGRSSVAVGFQAVVRDASQSGDPDGDEGTFVWADSTDAYFMSTGPNQFLIRATGGVAVNANHPLGFTLAVNGDAAKPGGGSWSTYSDSRLKTSVEPIPNALDRVLTLHGVEFEYSPEAIARGRGRPGLQVGFIAQNVEQVLPDWVGEDSTGFKHVTERGATALLVEALRELRAEKDRELCELHATLAERGVQLTELRSRLERLERILAENLTDSVRTGR